MKYGRHGIAAVLLAFAVAPAQGAQNMGARMGSDRVAGADETSPGSAAATTAAAEIPAGGVPATAAAAAISRGVEYSRAAQTATDPKVRAEAMQQAEQIYKDVAAANPKDGAALNNLAVLSVDKGDTAAARQYFESAIASKDGYEAKYALNYSKLLQQTDKQAAVEVARLAVKAAPGSAIANEQLGQLLWQTHPVEAISQANELLARGDSQLATRLAMTSLRSKRGTEPERRAWLILLTVRLAREYGISDDVRGSLGKDLAEFEADPMIGPGARQLRAAISAPPAGSAGLSWWKSQTSAPLPGTASGRAAMHGVLLAAGEAAAGQDFERADLYFKAAVDFGERSGEPDPDAFLRLVELYAGRRNIGGLQALMNRYQGELFSEKSRAYAEGNWPLIYRMHVALGMAYGYMKVWTSTSTFQNAIFQLSNAMKAAQRANSDPKWRANPLALPPIAIELLAEGYEAVGKKDLSLQTRVEGAAALSRVDRARDSGKVFRSISPADRGKLDAAPSVEYAELKTRLGRENL